VINLGEHPALPLGIRITDGTTTGEVPHVQMIDFALTGQHHARELPQRAYPAEGDKEHRNQMIIGLKAFIVAISLPGLCCPVNQTGISCLIMG